MKSLNEFLNEKYKDEWFRHDPSVNGTKVNYVKWALLTFLEKNTKPAKFKSVPSEVLESLPDYEQDNVKDYYWRIDKDKNYYAFDGDILDIDYNNTPFVPVYYRGQYKPSFKFGGNKILKEIEPNKEELKIYNDIIKKDKKLSETIEKAKEELKAIQLDAMYRY